MIIDALTQLLIYMVKNQRHKSTVQVNVNAKRITKEKEKLIQIDKHCSTSNK
jgi:hypothetical protein